MARDVTDDNFYVASSGGKVPAKWTAPEVATCTHNYNSHLVLPISYR